jgi:cytochrome P450
MTGYEYQDFDPYDETVAAQEILARYATLREKCPVGYSEAKGGGYFVMGDAEVKEAAKAADVFSSADGILFPPDPHPTFVPIEHDRPEHTWWRQIMSPPFTPQAVRELEPRITAVVDARIDTFIAAGRADLVTEFALRIPTAIIAYLLGFEDGSARQMVDVVDMFFETKGTERFPEWIAAFNEFVLAETAIRREHPRDDYLTQLIVNEHEGRMLTHEDLFSLMVSFALPGYESTVSGMATLLLHAGRDQELRERLMADPALIPGAVEEAVRIAVPLQFFRRWTTQDAVLGGVEIPAKSNVVLCYGAAAHDPRTTPNPEVFDPTRKINSHTGFGWGIHRCLGMGLARTEMRIALERILHRIPDYRVDDSAGFGPLIGGMVMTLTSLPITFEPRAA